MILPKLYELRVDNLIAFFHARSNESLTKSKFPLLSKPKYYNSSPKKMVATPRTIKGLSVYYQIYQRYFNIYNSPKFVGNYKCRFQKDFMESILFLSNAQEVETAVYKEKASKAFSSPGSKFNFTDLELDY